MYTPVEQTVTAEASSLPTTPLLTSTPRYMMVESTLQQ